MKKVALVYDYLVQYGGAEKVLAELCLMFPDAPIYTLVYDEELTGRVFAGRVIHTSFLQKIPKSASLYRFFAFLMPLMVERFDLSNYDLVISGSASFGKGVMTREHTKHICYCHTPTRFLWGDYRSIIGSSVYPKWISWVVPLFLPYLRVWDRQSVNRVDYFLCNSENTKNRIKRYYDRDAVVVYPPVNVDRFEVGEKKDYFLVVGRMLPYKRFDIAVRACSKMGLPLIVVGDGVEYKRLRSIAGESVKFVGKVSDERLKELYSGARGFIAQQEEDFGISAVEGLASGVPVISYRAGGALEYIIDGENGVFFGEQSVESLEGALNRFESMEFDYVKIKSSADRFSRHNFHKRIFEYVDKFGIDREDIL